ncbi:MAG: NAD(+) kinase [Gammaproteobacteria bacterium]|nr:NAD(+) kinase [Gammaproteobacteria bacterium]
MFADFQRVGIIGRLDKPVITDSLDQVVDVLQKSDRDIVIEEQTASLIAGDDGKVVRRTELHDCDLVIVVGGDGSILGIAKDLVDTDVPVLGINRGRLGFLADIYPDHIESGLLAVLQGSYRLEVHFLLEHSIVRDDELIRRGIALNDVVVNSGSITRMMDFALYVNEEFVYSQRSDGLIISTPTGSTAYALSAGGPIMHPTLDAIVIVPMFPHTLTSRPLVVKGDSEIVVFVNSEEDFPLVTADSQEPFILQPYDRVYIRKNPKGLNIVYPTTHNFYESCRSKLDWGSRLGGNNR